jgi:riboflavin kinase / FMN adenylyltransferase
MEVAHPEHCAPPAKGSAVTIGAYDGVHLGHRALLGELNALAAEPGLASAVVTFDRHPAMVVRPESAPLLLTDLDQKLELLAGCGIDRTLVIPFDLERANETAEDFVAEVLVDAMGARVVVVGEDFHFGHGRKGNVALLEELGADLGFEVVGIELRGDGEVVSSTRIRALVAEGRVDEAAVLLGRAHQVRGRVERGDARGGAELGFPTANVGVPREIAVPGDGVYAAWYRRSDGTRHRACVSIGHRPTFYDEGAPRLVEAYLLDFDGDLYGESAAVDFVAHLRPQVRFDSVEALVAQMNEDVEHTRACLGTAGDA